MSQKIYNNFSNSNTKKAQAKATFGFYDSLKLKASPNPQSTQSQPTKTVQSAFENRIELKATHKPKTFTLESVPTKTVDEAFLNRLAQMRKLRKKKRIKPARLLCATLSCSLFLTSIVLTCHHLKITNFEPAVYAENEYYANQDLTQQPLTIYIDQTTTTPKQAEIIREAIFELDEALKTVNFKIEEDERFNDLPMMITLTGANRLPNGINIKIKVDKINRPLSILGSASNLCFSPICAEIVITQKALNDPIKNSAKSVIQHEILHTLGLSHSKNITSIMFPENYYQTLTDKDIADVEIIFPPKNTNPETVFDNTPNPEK